MYPWGPSLMRDPDAGELIARASRDGRALAELMPLVYDELRRLARGYLGRERPGRTLQPTALVNEAYLRLLKDRKQDWRTRAHVVGIAAAAMRQILIEAARARDARKRGGGLARVTLDEGVVGDHAQTVDVLEVDRALTNWLVERIGVSARVRGGVRTWQDKWLEPSIRIRGFIGDRGNREVDFGVGRGFFRDSYYHHSYKVETLVGFRPYERIGFKVGGELHVFHQNNRHPDGSRGLDAGLLFTFLVVVRP